MKLMGRQALVTGADSGIGQAVAREFAREGANVVIHYHEDQEGAERTAAEVRSFGRRAAVIKHDLVDPDKARSLFDEAVLAVGAIDILVNCAGVSHGTDKSVEMSLDEFHRIIHINLISPWVLCQAAARHMGGAGGEKRDEKRDEKRGEKDGRNDKGAQAGEQGGGDENDRGRGVPNEERGTRGVIINITSVHETIPSWGGAAYDASKAGLRNITRNLARELAPKGIRVNNIAPGFIATPMNQETLEDPEEMEKSQAHTPLRRVGRPEEVAHVAVFLASEDSSYVTGSSYFVDGGLMQMTGAGA